jgi:threonine dehydrogenase-like Zn-dependent dehydrogenase
MMCPAMEHDFDGNPLAEGDRVTWHSLYCCYSRRFCLAGDHDLCVERKSLLRPSGGEYPYFLGTFWARVALACTAPLSLGGWAPAR